MYNVNIKKILLQAHKNSIILLDIEFIYSGVEMYRDQ